MKPIPLCWLAWSFMMCSMLGIGKNWEACKWRSSQTATCVLIAISLIEVIICVQLDLLVAFLICTWQYLQVVLDFPPLSRQLFLPCTSGSVPVLFCLPFRHSPSLCYDFLQALSSSVLVWVMSSHSLLPCGGTWYTAECSATVKWPTCSIYFSQSHCPHHIRTEDDGKDLCSHFAPVGLTLLPGDKSWESSALKR